jgi:hypothetical protein
MTVKTACDREDVSFMFVEATVRAWRQLHTRAMGSTQLTLLPSSMSVIICP